MNIWELKFQYVTSPKIFVRFSSMLQQRMMANNFLMEETIAFISDMPKFKKIYV